VSDLKASVGKKLQYDTAIVDRAFLNKYCNSITPPLEIESIRIGGKLLDLTGTDINEILDRFAEEQIEISNVSIHVREPWDSEEYARRELKAIHLYASDFQLTVDITGDSAEWIYGVEKSIDSIVNRGTRKHRWLKSQIFVVAIFTVAFLTMLAALIIAILKHHSSYISYVVVPLVIVGWIVLVIAWLLVGTSLKKRVIIVTGDYSKESVKNRLSSRDWKTFVLGVITTLLIGVGILLIQHFWK